MKDFIFVILSFVNTVSTIREKQVCKMKKKFNEIEACVKRLLWAYTNHELYGHTLLLFVVKSLLVDYSDSDTG